VAETLRIEQLSKTFPGQRALVDVDLTVEAGQVHALVGQNGSGKSTLIKVLAGYHQPDPGASAWVNGSPLTLGDGLAAAARGIRFVHQDLGLVGSVSTVENLALTNGYRTAPGRRIKWRDEVKAARGAMHSLGLGDVDVKAPVASLPPAQRTAVAIARSLVGWEGGASLLILDEPTATMPGSDVIRLFEVIHQLKAKGISILYVSHHLDEVFELADTVTVLRDARRVATQNVKDLDHDALIELIVGRALETTSAPATSATGSPLVRLRGLSGGNVHGVDLDVRPGEVVGIAGITGSGREHLLGLIAGQLPSLTGTVEVEGRSIKNYDPPDALKAGCAFVPSERGVRGVVPDMSVRENLTLCDVGANFEGGRLRRKKEVNETGVWISMLSIRTAGTEASIGSLSGGNQQKVMFGKSLRLLPRVLLLDEPTQGIDVGAKAQIHELVDRAAGDRVAVLVASTDTDELVRLCHRIVVLVDGRISTELTGSQITTDRIERNQLQSSRRTT
jgi:ribose transport system ATP-binding protein